MFSSGQQAMPYVPLTRHDLYDYGEMTALYYLKDFQDAYNAPLNRASRLGRRWSDRYESAYEAGAIQPFGHLGRATFDVLERLTRRYTKPTFAIDTVTSTEGHVYSIDPQPVMVKDFCTLLHFHRTPLQSDFRAPKNTASNLPNILIVAPYSGHYATLLRDMVRTFLPDHNVYITDWANGRDVPMAAGNFTLTDYIDYLIDFIKFFNGDVHLIAVCQPSVPVLAAISLLSDHADPATPHSMTLMGGPIDTRINPTAANIAAKTHTYEWFEESVIARVPFYYRGAMRRVCPGFILLSGFMSLNMERHLTAPRDLFKHLMQSDIESIDAHKTFYDEYRSVLDLPADYFLDSVRIAFQNHDLPKGTMTVKGDLVRPERIRRTWLFTVEGERDDISGVGQTKAAQQLCSGLDAGQKWHHVQEGVGHYGVFNGRRFRENIAPLIFDFVRQSEGGQKGFKPMTVATLPVRHKKGGKNTK